MKRGTPTNPKTKRLSRRLGVGFAATIGHLELLWHFTALHAPRGDVGRHSDDDIEDACGWDGEPGQLVAALVAERWLDSHPTARLIVHDLPDHADNGHKAKAAKMGGFILAEVTSTIPPTQAEVDPSPPPTPPESDPDRGRQGKGKGVGEGVGQGEGSGSEGEREGEPAPLVSPAVVFARWPDRDRRFGELHLARMGGPPDLLKLQRAVDTLELVHAPRTVLAHWWVYLERVDPQYVSPGRFVETFGRWAPDTGLASSVSPLRSDRDEREQREADEARAYRRRTQAGARAAGFQV